MDDNVIMNVTRHWYSPSQWREIKILRHPDSTTVGTLVNVFQTFLYTHIIEHHGRSALWQAFPFQHVPLTSFSYQGTQVCFLSFLCKYSLSSYCEQWPSPGAAQGVHRTKHTEFVFKELMVPCRCRWREETYFTKAVWCNEGQVRGARRRKRGQGIKADQAFRSFLKKQEWSPDLKHEEEGAR